MLSAKTGATIGELMAATGLARATTRAALTGLQTPRLRTQPHAARTVPALRCTGSPSSGAAKDREMSRRGRRRRRRPGDSAAPLSASCASSDCKTSTGAALREEWRRLCRSEPPRISRDLLHASDRLSPPGTRIRRFAEVGPAKPRRADDRLRRRRQNAANQCRSLRSRV